ncbi:MAG: hypothetical protein J1F68_00045 [Clostridiales bacterium]|nr:hypothetical protein [Clostridiales bacterium]
MLTVGIVDDGIGFVPTLTKLKQVVSAHFICMVNGDHFPLGNCNGKALITIGSSALTKLTELGCDAVVFSSVALSSRCLKPLTQAHPDVAIFGCDAPVMHASTYTASRVLVVGDAFAVRSQSLSGVIPVAMPDFPALAEVGDERDIVRYISECCEQLYGQFDCIALANSSMNMYKHCFSRVFPNVQIFDSLEGVARRIRKKYRKFPKDDSVVTVIDASGAEIGEKYSIFLD